jgi:hypothetical protein
MENQFRVAMLRYKLKNYKRTVIYGAGYFAKLLISEMSEHGLAIDYCVVSSKNNSQDEIEGVPMYEFSECIEDIRNGDVIVIVAVTEKYEDEIVNILIENDINNYLLATDHVKKFIMNKYMNKSNIDILDIVTDWYVDNHKLKIDEFDNIRKRLEVIECEYEQYKNKDKIVFLIANISPRIIKMAEALDKEGYKIYAIYYPNVIMKNMINYKIIDLCEKKLFCSNVEELLYNLIISKAMIIHLFSDIGNSDISHFLIRHKKLFPKIVFEQYDIANDMYSNSLFSTINDKRKDEKYCLENADGICSRGFELDYLINSKKIRIKGKNIIFFDYCNDEIVSKNKDNDESLSICYAGGIATEQQYPGAPYACFLMLAKKCEENRCHFHVYPSIMDKNGFKDYIELDKKSKYFHFHNPIPYNELKQELSQYDYGVHPIRENFLNNEAIGYVTKNKMIYSVTNHIFDYLDAGLPIIAASPVEFIKYFEDEGVLINWTIDEYDFELLKLKRDEMKQEVIEVHEKLSIKNHINELLEFYDSVVKEKDYN